MKRIRKDALIVLLILAGPIGGFAQLYFAPRVNYPLPVSSTFVNVLNGDFNKDGIPDLAVANFSGASISVFIGLGPGTFGASQNYTTGSGTGGIAELDANEDGNPDLAVTNFNSNTISVFLGNGTGTFSPQVTFSTGSGPQSPILGDYNEDGNIDIAVANYTGNTFSILLGNGTGSFTPTIAYPTGANPEVVTADLNQDGHLDLVIYHVGGGNIGVRLGTGAGTFGSVQTYTTGSEPRTVVIRDFNSDNILDVVVGNTLSNTVSLLTGTGSGTLNPAVNFSTTGPSTIISNDYNADGKFDLAVANTGNNTVSIYTGNDAGSFSLYQFTTVGSNPAYMRLIILDLNNDNLFDIVTTNDGANLFGVLLGNIPPGGAGTALKFNGTNQEAQLGTWFNHQNFTVTMWVKPGATQVANANIIDNNHTVSRSWALEQNGSVLNQYVFGGVQLNLTANVWQYIALVSNGGVSTVYRNGCLVGSFNSGAINYDGSQTLRLANFAGGGRNWNGELDEVRIYDTGFSLNQVQSSINGEIATNAANLIAYYRMNEGSGTFIYDGTVNNHVSNLINGPVFQPSDWSLPIPTLTNFSPPSGPVGTVVTLTGTNFDVTPINNVVTFNGTAATVTASTATNITTTVPAGATTGKISVMVNCFTVLSTTDFTVTASGSITITTQPTNFPACPGDIATFTTAASGATNIAYHWQIEFDGIFSDVTDGGGYLGVNTPTFTINTNQNNGIGIFRCRITGDGAPEVFTNEVSITLKFDCQAGNAPPVIEPSTTGLQAGGTVTIDLSSLISDPDDNLDLSTLQLVNGVSEQGALASLNGVELVLNYNGINFLGTDHVRLTVCDLEEECVEQELTIEVGGDIIVFNAISPNGDTKNDIFLIQYLDVLPNAAENHVTIFNRWGDLVFEISDYNNEDRVFTGLNKNGKELPSGTYYYMIEFSGGKKAKTGYLSLKR